MPMVGRRDQHGIDIPSAEDLPVVARGKHIRAPKLLRVRKPPIVAIGHRYQLHTRHLQRGARVALALDTRPDQRKLNGVIGRARSRLLRGKPFKPGAYAGNKRRLRHTGQEVPAIDHGHASLYSDSSLGRRKASGFPLPIRTVRQATLRCPARSQLHPPCRLFPAAYRASNPNS